jgi:hypothetical protein
MPVQSTVQPTPKRVSHRSCGLLPDNVPQFHSPLRVTVTVPASFVTIDVLVVGSGFGVFACAEGGIPTDSALTKPMASAPLAIADRRRHDADRARNDGSM